MASIVTFNCNSIRKNVDKVKTLAESFDIIMLQELMLMESDAGFLDKIHKDYIAFSHLKDRKINGVNIGRPINGVAFLVNSALKDVITPVYISERFIGLIIDASPSKVLLINAYMPVDRQCYESFHNFKNELSVLGATIQHLQINNILIAGDLNANSNKTLLWNEILDFCREFSMEVQDNKLPSDSFTYLSPSCNNTSWLDHVISSKHLSDKIHDLEILYGFSLFDHFPVAFNFNIQFFKPYKYLQPNKNFDVNAFVNWNSLKTSDFQLYRDTLQHTIELFPYHLYSSFNCYNSNCDKPEHRLEIDSIFKFLVNSLNSASNVIRKCKIKKYNIVPGWNERVKECHKTAREHLFSWIQNGRPRNGSLYEDMIRTRASFRKCLKKCKAEELNIRNAKFVKSLKEKNTKEFWKLVRNNKSPDKKVVHRIDNVTDPDSIAQLFANKFQKIFDDKRCQSKNKFNNFPLPNPSLRYFSTSLIFNAIKELNPTLDHYNIHANHLKYGPDILITFISKFFSICYRHSFLPEDMLNGVLSPLIKDNFGNHETSENYRPIISSSVLLKVLEYAIKKKSEHLLTPNERQFGFKCNSSTQFAGLTLKEIAHKYLQQGSSVYAGFLDISKAFDKVSHKLLLETLYERQFDIGLINLINNWYGKQQVKVRFDGCFSNALLLNNGVRQGGILSPYFFIIYIDKIIDKLSKLNHGCSLGFVKINSIFFADDCILIAPTATALQFLFNWITRELSLLCLTLNPSKCAYMKIRSKRVSGPDDDNIVISVNGIEIKRVTEHKYLGFTIDDFLIEKMDIIRARNKFYNVFNLLLRKFHYLDTQAFLKIFETHCSHFYGAQIWLNDAKCSNEINKFSIGYHKAIKKIANAPFFYSNHHVCNSLNILMLH